MQALPHAKAWVRGVTTLRGELYTVEGASGDVTRIDLQSRAKTTVARLRPGIDNFAFHFDAFQRIQHAFYIDIADAENPAEDPERAADGAQRFLHGEEAQRRGDHAQAAGGELALLPHSGNPSRLSES